jgi:tetratricopeptide (TPR) repeat protein
MSSDPGLLPSLKKLQRTIKSERRVLETLPEAAHKDVAYANLAGSLSDLFDITGDQAALEEAIELGRKALSSCTDDDPDRAEYCTQLAGDLSKLYKYTYDGNALEEAIQLARQALALCPTLEQDPDSEQPRDVCCYELAICLKQRYARTGDILVLEESIQLFRETLSLRPIGHFARQETCSSLGIALRDRYKVAHDEEDIHEALRLQREALLICPSDSKWLATLHNDVADCLDDIFDLTGDVKLLEEALELDRKALSFPCHKPDDHTTRMIALCYRIWAIYLRTKDVGILDEAMLHVDEQLSDSVSRLHQDELWCLASVIHLERDTPHFDPTRAVTYLRYLVETPQSDIAWLWETLLPLLHSLVALDDIRSKEFASSTLQVLSSAINLLPKRAGFVLDPQHQLQNIQEASELGLQALTVATYAGQPNIGLELMEYTRGFMWSQALYVHDPQLRDLPADLGEELKKLLMAMRDKPKAPWSKFLTPEDMHRALMELRHTKASRIEAILRDVRQLPGLEHFMTGPSLTQLHHLAQVCPYAIVVLAVTGQICRAYMVRPPREENENSEDRLMVLDLPITLPELEKLGKATSNSAIRQSLYRGHNPEFEPTRAMIVGRAKSHANGLEIIWKKIVHPVLQALQLDQVGYPMFHELF